MARVASAIGLALPVPNATSDGGTTPSGSYSPALFAAATDVTEARTAIAVAGPRARELMAKATSLELHPRVFRVGLCDQTGFALVCITLDDGALGGPA